MIALTKYSFLFIILLLASCDVQAAEQDILQSPAWQEPISLEIRNDLLGTVLDNVIKPTGTRYSIDPALRFIVIPSLTIREFPRRMALKTVLKINDLNHRVADNTIIIEAKPGKMDAWLKKVTVAMEDSKLVDVLPGLFKAVDIGLVLDPGAADLIVDYIQLKDVSFIEALYKVLDQAGAVYSGSDVVHILPKPTQAVETGPVVKRDVDVVDPSLPHVKVIREADNKDPWLKRVSVDVKDSPLRNVLDELFRSTGLNYAIEPYSGVLAVNSLNMKDVTLREALDELMNITGARYRIEQGSVVVIQADPQTKVDSTISLDVKDMPLPDVMEILFKGSGLNYAIDPNVSQLRVTATLSRAPFKMALDSLVKAAGLAYRVDNGIYRISAQPKVATVLIPGKTFVSDSVQAETQSQSQGKLIQITVEVEAVHPAKGKTPAKKVMINPSVATREGQKATVSIATEVPPQPDRDKQILSLISVSLVPTIQADGLISISGTMDYVQDEYSARNVKILATLQHGKPYKLPPISVPSTKDKSKASINLTFTAALGR